MKSVLRKILAVFLLGIFLYPLPVKALHNHDHESKLNNISKKYIHSAHDKCYVYEYAFSIFNSEQHSDIKPFELLKYTYFETKKHIVVSLSQKQSFLLRAPPILLIYK